MNYIEGDEVYITLLELSTQNFLIHKPKIFTLNPFDIHN